MRRFVRFSREAPLPELPHQSPPPTRDARSVIDRGLLALVESGRAHPLRVLLLSIAIEAALLGILGSFSSTHNTFGLPGSFGALSAVIAGALAGPLIGAAVALAGGGVLYVAVSDFGTEASVLATALSTAIWLCAGLLSGLLAESLREREARRRETALALAETRSAHAAQVEIANLHTALEANLMPATPLLHPALTILTAYRPGEERLKLGGDFFDIRPTAGGGLALIIGDVSGHGPEAAALGARLRAAWQGLLLAGADGRTVISSLDQMVSDRNLGENFVTACLAWLHPGHKQASFLSAGHPAPVLLAEEVVTVQVPPCLPLGLGSDGGCELFEVQLPEQWALFFYTDGLIEGRATPGSPTRYGEARLKARLQEESRSLDEGAVSRLMADIADANGGGLSDDSALILVAPKAGGDSE